MQKRRDWKTEVFVLVGPTGSGKTRWVHDREPILYNKQRSNWWDGLDGMDAVLIDDFYGWLTFDELLRITDRYALMVQSKGGQLPFLAKRVYITSNKPPSMWYKKQKYLESFERRVEHFMWCPTEGEFQEMSMLTLETMVITANYLPSENLEENE